MSPNTSITIRPAEERDYDLILTLNADNVEVLSPMDIDSLKAFARYAEIVWVAEYNARPAGFIIALRESADEYQSENYRWFRARYDRFLYIDRVVIADDCRGKGIGRALYRSVFNHAARTNVPVVTAEIDTIPYNAASLAFHKTMGFAEVGEQFVRNNTIKVSLQAAPVSAAPIESEGGSVND